VEQLQEKSGDSDNGNGLKTTTKKAAKTAGKSSK